MTISKQVKSHIAKLPAGKAFTTASLYSFAVPDTVRKTLGRLAKSGEIKRLAPGVFAKPKQTRFGPLLPSPREAIKAIAKSTGEIIAPHGAEAALKLQLSTQVPMKLVLYTSGKSREIKIHNQVVSLRHISPRKLVAPNTVPGLVITALWYLGQRHVTVASIQTIARIIESNDLTKVFGLIEYMPNWMANVFHQYQDEIKKAA